MQLAGSCAAVETGTQIIEHFRPDEIKSHGLKRLSDEIKGSRLFKLSVSLIVLVLGLRFGYQFIKLAASPIYDQRTEGRPPALHI